jgi:hypothetical protein
MPALKVPPSVARSALALPNSSLLLLLSAEPAPSIRPPFAVTGATAALVLSLHSHSALAPVSAIKKGMAG